MTEMIALQEVWEASGGHPEIKATREEVLLVLKLMDECVDEQDEDIKKLEAANKVNVEDCNEAERILRNIIKEYTSSGDMVSAIQQAKEFLE